MLHRPKLKKNFAAINILRVMPVPHIQNTGDFLIIPLNGPQVRVILIFFSPQTKLPEWPEFRPKIQKSAAQTGFFHIECPGARNGTLHFFFQIGYPGTLNGVHIKYANFATPICNKEFYCIRTIFFWPKNYAKIKPNTIFSEIDPHTEIEVHAQG